MIYLRTQTALQNEISRMNRNQSESKWTEREILISMNQCLQMWSEKVKIPFVYTITDGWSSSTLTVDLPDYIDAAWVRPQMLVTNTGVTESDVSLSTYVPMKGYEIEPNATGGWTLRIRQQAYSALGRIIYWMSPGRIPESLAVVATDSGTSITVTTDDGDMGRCGYVKINNEWIQYSGFATDGTTVTLSNLVRAMNGTTEATHSTSDVVEWGIPVDKMGLYNHMVNQCVATMHTMSIMSESTADRENHQFILRYSQQIADEFWRGYVCAYEPVMMLDTRGQMSL